ncbi:hypothetical protein GGF42_009135, partial [Coemansia sp. RSA 2424]
RKLASMRWTALDAIGDGSAIEEEGFRRQVPRPEDDEDADIFDIVQAASSASGRVYLDSAAPTNRNGAYKHLPSGDEIVAFVDDDDDDDARTKGNSSKDSADSVETERL